MQFINERANTAILTWFKMKIRQQNCTEFQYRPSNIKVSYPQLYSRRFQAREPSQLVLKRERMTGNHTTPENTEQKNDGNRQSSKENQKAGLVQEARRIVALLLEAIEEESNSPEKIEGGTTFSKTGLRAFATSSSISVEKFKLSGGVKALISALKNHSTCSPIVDYGCQALLALILYEKSTVDEMAKAGAIEAVVTVLDAQSSDGTENACVSSLKTLRSLTQTAEYRNRIWNNSGIEAIVKAMTSRTGSGRLLSHAALVLSNLVFGSAEIKDAVGVLGGIAAISDGMRQHKDFQALQGRGSLALRNLCYQSEQNQRIAGDSGVATALIEAIQSYIEDREVVHQSCVALVNLSSSSEENRTRIVEAKGCAALVNLMQTYSESVTVHEDCISIIRNIAVNSVQAQIEIGLHGGIVCICQALKKFSKNEKMAGKACTALRYLCFLPKNRQKVGSCQGMEAIVESLKTNQNNPEIVENAFLALGNATFESEENKTTVGHCGGITQIITVAERHRLNAGIQEHGCRVLRNLSDGLELNRRIEAESGAIKTAMYAMVGFPENPSVQEQACAMLLNIALGAVYIDMMKEADVERLAERALNIHQKHRGVQLQAGTLLDRLNGYDVPGADGDIEPNEQVEGVKLRGLRKFLSSSNRGTGGLRKARTPRPKADAE